MFFFRGVVFSCSGKSGRHWDSRAHGVRVVPSRPIDRTSRSTGYQAIRSLHVKVGTSGKTCERSAIIVIPREKSSRFRRSLDGWMTDGALLNAAPNPCDPSYIGGNLQGRVRL